MCIKYHSIMQTIWSKLVYLWRRRWRPAANVQLHTLTLTAQRIYTLCHRLLWLFALDDARTASNWPLDFNTAGPSINIIKFAFMSYLVQCFCVSIPHFVDRIIDHWCKLLHHLACTNPITVAKTKNKTHRNSSIDKNGKIMRIHASGSDLYAKSGFAYDASWSIESWIDTSFQFLLRLCRILWYTFNDLDHVRSMNSMIFLSIALRKFIIELNKWISARKFN